MIKTAFFEHNEMEYKVILQTKRLRNELIIVPDENGWFLRQDSDGGHFLFYSSTDGSRTNNHEEVFKKANEAIKVFL